MSRLQNSQGGDLTHCSLPCPQPGQAVSILHGFGRSGAEYKWFRADGLELGVLHCVWGQYTDTVGLGLNKYRALLTLRLGELGG